MTVIQNIKTVVNIIKDERTINAFKQYYERCNAINKCCKQDIKSAYKLFLKRKAEIKEEYAEYQKQNMNKYFAILDEVSQEHIQKMEQKYANKTVKHVKC